MKILFYWLIDFFYSLGSGYAELLSYCTCDEDTNTPFALCDKRAGICSSKQGNYPSSDTSKLGKIKGFLLQYIKTVQVDFVVKKYYYSTDFTTKFTWTVIIMNLRRMYLEIHASYFQDQSED